MEMEPRAVAQTVQEAMDRAVGAAHLGRNMTLYARRS